MHQQLQNKQGRVRAVSRFGSQSKCIAESYTYDALCRRVSTTTREGTTRHVYDDSWQVVADLDEDGDVVASYTWGDGIDNLLAVNVSGVTYYPLTDIQGTVWGYVDSQNNVVARWQYDAWGNVVDGEASVPALATLRYRFQGREWSAATGLVNFRMRWYDAVTGLWLSKDPIGLSGGLNLYAFCGNDLTNFRDPIGLCSDYDGGIGVMDWTAYEFGMSSYVRDWYVRSVSRLSPDDGLGRSEIKVLARSKTPVVVRTIIEASRPGVGPRAGSVGHANVSNARVNGIAGGFGGFARGIIAVSIAIEIYNVASAPEGERAAAAARACGHIAGGVVGGEAGAAVGSRVGSLVGPVGGVAGAMVGGVLGGYYGGEISAQAVDNIMQ